MPGIYSMDVLEFSQGVTILARLSLLICAGNTKAAHSSNVKDLLVRHLQREKQRTKQSIPWPSTIRFGSERQCRYHTAGFKQCHAADDT